MLIGIAPDLAAILEPHLEELGYVVLNVAHVHAAVVRIGVTKPELVLVPLEDIGRDLPALRTAVDEVSAQVAAIPREDPLTSLTMFMSAARVLGI